MFHTRSIESIKKKLVEHQHTLAVAESVSSGLLQAAFSTAENAMDFFQGGLTAYNLGQKARHLHIDPIRALNCNCVSMSIAEDMAKSVCLKFSSDWGLGITGYASPVPESGNEQFAYFAICFNGEIKRSRKIEFENGQALDAQLFYVNTALDEFAALLDQSD